MQKEAPSMQLVNSHPKSKVKLTSTPEKRFSNGNCASVVIQEGYHLTVQKSKAQSVKQARRKLLRGQAVKRKEGNLIWLAEQDRMDIQSQVSLWVNRTRSSPRKLQVSTQAMPNSSEREGRVHTPPIHHPQSNTETQKRVQSKEFFITSFWKGTDIEGTLSPWRQWDVILEPSITSNLHSRHYPALEQGMPPGQLSQPFKTTTLRFNFAEVASHPCQAGFNSWAQATFGLSHLAESTGTPSWWAVVPAHGTNSNGVIKSDRTLKAHSWAKVG